MGSHLSATTTRFATAGIGGVASRTVPFLQMNGTRLHYERTGAGDPLVLVHGSWVDGSVWEAVLPTLARSFEVVSYDRRGHGRSSCPPGQGSVLDDVEDLAALIELLGLTPAYVAGASWGGSIALRLAAAHPELVRSVAVHEPPLFDLLESEAADWPELAELRARLAAVATRLEAGDLEGAGRALLRSGGGHGWRLGGPRPWPASNAPGQCPDLPRSVSRSRGAGHRPRGHWTPSMGRHSSPMETSGRRSSSASSICSSPPCPGPALSRFPAPLTIRRSRTPTPMPERSRSSRGWS